MKAGTPAGGPEQRSGTRRGIVRWLFQIGVFILILAASLFLSAGRLDWAMGWGYVGTFVALQGLNALVLIPTSPDLVAERARRGGKAKGWDRLLAALVAFYGPVSTWVVAGLDLRFGWSPKVPLALEIAALAVAVLGALLTLWAMASNRFFSGVVRIQADRGHAVVSAGPYRIVRHPGYLGGMAFDLATPLALGSLWSFVPAALTVCAIAVRTALEDRTLHDELDGYRAYARRVRHRLLPGVW